MFKTLSAMKVWTGVNSVLEETEINNPKKRPETQIKMSKLPANQPIFIYRALF